MADLVQIVFGKTGHFHNGITIETVLQHGTGYVKGGFTLTFFNTTLFPKLYTFLYTLLNTLLDTFLFKLFAMVMSASPCCGTRCASSRTKASASEVLPACKI